jgi:hypothetical protein
MNKTFEVLPVATRDTNGESAIFANASTTGNPGAGAFVIDVKELAEGAHLVACVLDAENRYVIASNRIDRPGKSSLVIGEGLAVERPNVYAPHTLLPDEFKLAYVVSGGAVTFGVEATTI